MKSRPGRTFVVIVSTTFCLFASSVYSAEEPSGPIDIAKLQQFKKSCAGLPTTITRDQIRIAMNGKLFPGPLDSMGEFLERVERGAAAKKSADACSVFQSDHALPSHPLFRESKVPPIFQDVVRRATDLLVRDMKSQLELARNGLYCAEKIEAMTPDQSDRCRDFVTEYIPDLQERFETMRTFLAIGSDQVGSSKIKTDASMLSSTIAPYFPTVWRKQAAKEIAPLSEGRKKALSDLKSLNSEAKEAALKRSYAILSTAPILSTFSDTPVPKSIAAAFRILNRQMAEDIKEIENEVPQEITLLIPYVMQTLSQMPIEQRGDACLIFQELQENMVKRYIKIPFWETVVGLSFAGMGGLSSLKAARSGSTLRAVGQNLSQFLKGLSPGASATMAVSSATAGSNGLRDYFYRTKLCSVVTDANNPTARVASLCDFGAAETGLRTAQESAISQAFFGATIFGVGRFLK